MESTYSIQHIQVKVIDLIIPSNQYCLKIFIYLIWTLKKLIFTIYCCSTSKSFHEHLRNTNMFKMFCISTSYSLDSSCECVLSGILGISLQWQNLTLLYYFILLLIENVQIQMYLSFCKCFFNTKKQNKSSKIYHTQWVVRPLVQPEALALSLKWYCKLL